MAQLQGQRVASTGEGTSQESRISIKMQTAPGPSTTLGRRISGHNQLRSKGSVSKVHATCNKRDLTFNLREGTKTTLLLWYLLLCGIIQSIVLQIVCSVLAICGHVNILIIQFLSLFFVQFALYLKDHVAHNRASIGNGLIITGMIYDAG